MDSALPRDLIDPRSAVAPYEQLRGGIVAAVSSGRLVAGHRLPTVRGLAGELGIAPGTVARAYRELEASGVVETRGRHGTFVAFSEDPAREQAQRAAAAFAEQMRALRVDTADALALAAAALTQ